STPTPLFGSAEELLGLLQGDGEDLLLGLQGTAVGALLHVGPETAVLCRDLFTVEFTDDPGQGQQTQRVLESDGVQAHGLEQGGRSWLDLGLALVLGFGLAL